MCFSATASFVASGVIGSIGGASLRVAKKGKRFIAIVPFAFALQQFLEGLVWLLPETSMWRLGAAYGFVFFALLFWPVVAPTLVYVLEKDPSRKPLLASFGTIGLLVALAFLLALARYPLGISEVGHHLVYDIGLSWGISMWLVLFYVLATCGGFIASTDKWLRGFGTIMLSAAVFSMLVSDLAFASVWCFFGALVSGLLYLYVKRA